VRVFVNHLTRMAEDRICVAGIEAGGERDVRPITRRQDPLTRGLLKENGGPFALGALVDIRDARPTPTHPETEDHWVWLDRLRAVGQLSPEQYLDLIDAHCEETLEGVFGSALQRHGWTYAVDEGDGDASLGCLRPRRRPRLEVNDRGRLRLRLAEADAAAFLAVTDLRFFEADGDIRRELVEAVAARMRRGVPVRVMVGLGRAWAKEDGDQRHHWLQVNGICLEDRPLG